MRQEDILAALRVIRSGTISDILEVMGVPETRNSRLGTGNCLRRLEKWGQVERTFPPDWKKSHAPHIWRVV